MLSKFWSELESVDQLPEFISDASDGVASVDQHASRAVGWGSEDALALDLGIA